jgi:hypothetical protein
MTWFTYTKSSSTVTPPVRRKIVFPFLNEFLKVGDWVHVNLNDLDLNRYYYYEDGLIKNKADSDSYVVVYETDTSYTVTQSLLVGNPTLPAYENNLWFKSVANVDASQKPVGNYYIYYHKDDIQYLTYSGNSYVSTTNPGGANFIATETQGSSNSVDFYSTVVTGDANNIRIANLSYLGDSGIWVNKKSSTVGSKLMGTFSGPNLKIYAEKTPNSGILLLKIIKTSANGSGQSIIKQGVEIDLYASTVQENQLVYTFSVEDQDIFSTYDEIYGDFSFEIEISSNKNTSSTSNDVKISSYSFSKNYLLEIDQEEINSSIAFKTTGSVK